MMDIVMAGSILAVNDFKDKAQNKVNLIICFNAEFPHFCCLLYVKEREQTIKW